MCVTDDDLPLAGHHHGYYLLSLGHFSLDQDNHIKLISLHKIFNLSNNALDRLVLRSYFPVSLQ